MNRDLAGLEGCPFLHTKSAMCAKRWGGERRLAEGLTERRRRRRQARRRDWATGGIPTEPRHDGSRRMRRRLLSARPAPPAGCKCVGYRGRKLTAPHAKGCGGKATHRPPDVHLRPCAGTFRRNPSQTERTVTPKSDASRTAHKHASTWTLTTSKCSRATPPARGLTSGRSPWRCCP